MYLNWSPNNMKICPQCHGRKLLLYPEHFSFKLLTMLVYAEIWVVNFYFNHCTCIPIVMMKGRFKLVQTWWLCERRISSMRASTQNHDRKRVHHCSWEAMQITSSSRDITVMWSIGTKNISCSWTQHQLQHQLVFLIAHKALPNLVIIVCCMAAVIWGDCTSPVSFLLVQQQVLWFVDEKKTNDDRKWTH
jgi:hypothetical protein